MHPVVTYLELNIVKDGTTIVSVFFGTAVYFLVFLIQGSTESYASINIFAVVNDIIGFKYLNCTMSNNAYELHLLSACH